MKQIKGEHVYLVRYNAGVLGVYAEKIDAMREAEYYRIYDYKGVKVEEHLIG